MLDKANIKIPPAVFSKRMLARVRACVHYIDIDTYSRDVDCPSTRDVTHTLGNKAKQPAPPASQHQSAS